MAVAGTRQQAQAGAGAPLDQEQTWAVLEAGVERIMTRLRDGIDMKTYMRLYSAVHDFCTSQKGLVPAASTPLSLQQTSGQRGAHLLGEDLYRNLITYLSAHLEGVFKSTEGMTDDALLTHYIKEYKRFTTAAQYDNHVFQYLNRHWVKREMDEGKKNVYDIYTLHLVQWRDVMFQKTQERVMKAVLELTKKQRDGETIDHAQIKAVVDSFVALGIDDGDCTKGTLEVYKKYFEGPYLNETKRYYEVESKEFLAGNSVVDYMKKAESRLDEEKEHVHLYLLDDIMNPLSKTCNAVLIADHAAILRDEFNSLLDKDRIDDLARMYKLLGRIPDGLDPLRSRFEKYVVAQGKASVDRVSSEAGADLDPKSYVDALLSVHTKYADLVNKAFNGESDFIRSLDSACREFVNHNSVCDKSSNKSPELLAKYADSLLRKSTKSAEEDDMETLLTQIMTVFKYIDDKDVFQKFYSKQLARRLVQTTSASDDAETNMIAKLKEACGFEYTNKLTRMFQDMQISKDLNANYKEHKDALEIDKKAEIDATYNILGTGFWPLQAPTTRFVAPESLQNEYSRFVRFYDQNHRGRKLTWLWHLSKGEIRANHLKMGGKIPYTFQVSTYQMGILLLFNKSDSISYDEIAAETQLNKETLDPSIAIMVKAKVINPEPEGAGTESGTTYKVNYGFKNKKLKVNLNIAIKSETKQEVEDTHKTIEEDRKLLIQSAIVRIMKSRKKLRHQILITETISQISQRFKPTVQDIKKCIDILIEKEYLERGDGDELNYLA